ncbi:MAG: hypothetical protein IJC85_05915 [Oscillospiraceae bacterium]|nr:hypothetical protein [Oscillospiraceae bacterium]
MIANENLTPAFSGERVRVRKKIREVGGLIVMEVDLMPICLKKQMNTIKKVSICVEIGVVFLLLVMGIAGFFKDLTTGIIFTSILLLITTLLMIPGFLFEKISQSTVRFAEDRIQVLDKNGICWRTIFYREITNVRIEEVSGFFYGQNQNLFRNTYICIFLNGSTSIPDVSFSKIFTDKDFIMLGYHAEVFLWLRQELQLS